MYVYVYSNWKLAGFHGNSTGADKTELGTVEKFQIHLWMITYHKYDKVHIVIGRKGIYLRKF